MKTMTATKFILVFFLVINIAAEAQENRIVGFNVHGAVYVSNFNNTNSSIISHDYCEFSISVAGAAWNLILTPTNGTEYKYACDGTNVVEMFYDSNPKLTNYSIPAVLHRDGFPSDGYYSCFIWLAYGSSDYLNQNRPLAAPWIMARSDPRAFMYEPTIQRFKEIPELPSDVAFTANVSLAKSAASNPMLKVEDVNEGALNERRLVAASVHDGFKAADFHVITTTNLGAFLIPTQFKLTLFRPYVPPYVTNIIGTEIIGLANQVDLLSERPDWPQLSERGVSVTDRRFRSENQGIDCIQYKITNNWILDTSSPFLVERFNAKKHRSPFIRVTLFERSIFLCIFGFLAVLPAIVWLCGRLRKKGKQQNDNKQ